MRRLVAAVIVAGAAVIVVGAGAAVLTGPRAAAQPFPSAVSLLGQTPYVEQAGTFRLRLAIQAVDPSTDVLQVLGYNSLVTRTDFDNAVGGQHNSFSSYKAIIPVSALRPDAAGGVDVDIPVNEPPSRSSPIGTFDAQAGSAIFPLQVGVYSSSGSPEGQALDTFLVYAAGPPSITGYSKLNVALVLPVSSPPQVTPTGHIAPVSAGESARLSSLALALAAHSAVTVNLQASPQTLDELAGGSTIDRNTLSIVGSLSEYVLPATYSQVSVGDLLAAGLGGEVRQQTDTGSAVLARVFGSQPSPLAWAVGGNLTSPEVSALVGSGATSLVVPATDLTAPPSLLTQTTFAWPTGLATGARTSVPVFAADAGLTSDFVRDTDPVLAANQLLAEMTMIQLELPGEARGVVAMPPPGWSADPSFVATLLAGLDHNPLLASVSVPNLFKGVPSQPVTQQLSSPTAGIGGSLAGDVAFFQSARSEVAGIATMLPGDASAVSTLQTELLTAESADVTEVQRLSLLGSIQSTWQKLVHVIDLPGSSSITLTSTRGQIPLTILSLPNLRARVRLELRSQRLIFEPFSPPNGTCSIPAPTSEVCQLVLVAQNTTLKVPVQTRSSGVFPLDVTLSSPDGAELLARDSDTVRSTAVSGVGLVLSVVAVASLGIWWVRDLRRGRRARRLVPSPIEEPEPDPIVDAFFSNPPPSE